MFSAWSPRAARGPLMRPPVNPPMRGHCGTICTLVLLAVLLGAARVTAGGEVILIAPPGAVVAGATVTVGLAVLNSGAGDEHVELPAVLTARMRNGTTSVSIDLRAAGDRPAVIDPGAFVAQPYTLRLPPGVRGQVVIELGPPFAARAIVEVGRAAEEGPAESTPAMTTQGPPAPAVSVTEDESWRVFGGHFSPHLPIHFLFGPDKPAAKFQFSFKYRVWGSGRNPAMPAEPAHGIYFGYTQRSLWDITAYSSPFYDTSYMPELMYQYRPPPTSRSGWRWYGFQASVQHESNGKDEPDSRSMNLVYFKPTVGYVTPNGWQLIFTPKVFYYIDNLSDNPDLPRYRGYGEYTLTILKSNIALSLLGRIGSRADRGSIQADLSVPVRMSTGGFGTFLVIQYFDGYGESLLDYRSKSRTIRAGVALVR